MIWLAAALGALGACAVFVVYAANTAPTRTDFEADALLADVDFDRLVGWCQHPANKRWEK